MPIRFNVKHLVDARGWSVRQFAVQAGLTYASAHGMYRNTATRVDLGTLALVIKALGVKIEDILIYEDDAHDDDSPSHG